MVVDLTEEYPNRNIEGIDKKDLLDSLNGKSEDFKWLDSGMLQHIPSGKKIVLSCISKYFEPPKSFYHLEGETDCRFIQTALEIPYHNRMIAGNCRNCLRECLIKGRKIKPEKFRMSQSYFVK